MENSFVCKILGHENLVFWMKSRKEMTRIYTSDIQKNLVFYLLQKMGLRWFFSLKKVKMFKHCYIFLLRNKYEVLKIFKHFESKVENQLIMKNQILKELMMLC